jgi:hypothetical protein
VANDVEAVEASASHGVAGQALLAANINPATGLATDYLNHFNEIIMLIGLVGDMPEMITEIRAWQPASYEEHFDRSGFTGKALAIAAYRAAPARIRRALAHAVNALDRSILEAIARFEASTVISYPRLMEEADRALRPLMARVSAVIHGVDVKEHHFAARAARDSVDALLV